MALAQLASNSVPSIISTELSRVLRATSLTNHFPCSHVFPFLTRVQRLSSEVRCLARTVYFSSEHDGNVLFVSTLLPLDGQTLFTRPPVPRLVYSTYDMDWPSANTPTNE